MDSKQANAARENLDELMRQMRGYPPSRVAAVVWDWMGAQGFRAEAHTTPNEAERLAFIPAGNEKLIEEAAKEILRTAHDLAGIIANEKGEQGAREYARAALAVFEKAHTPTDAEREETTDAALWDFADSLLEAWNIEDQNPPSLAEDFRDRFVARFRRSVAPEPSAEVEFPFTHEGVTLEQDDGGVWVSMEHQKAYWIGSKALAAIRASERTPSDAALLAQGFTEGVNLEWSPVVPRPRAVVPHHRAGREPRGAGTVRFKRNASGRGGYFKGRRISIAYRGFRIRPFVRLTSIRMGDSRLYTLGPLAVFVHD